jgi:CHAD domain-containing protein
MTAEEELRTVVTDCLSHVRRHEAGVVAGEDPESVHRMRVGLRRLKCALQLFAAARPLWRAQRDDLDWMATTLGGARDWDVLAHDTLASLDAHPDVDRAALLQAARRVAREKHGRPGRRDAAR